MRILFISFILAAALLLACSKEKAESSASADSITVTMIAEDSLTVLDLVQQEHSVVYRSSSLGAFVTSIDSVETGDGHFWTYTVNGESIPTACDKYMIGPGDTVTWRFGE